MRDRYLHRYREQSFAIRAYDMSAVGIDDVSVHKLFAYRFISTVRIDVVSGHMKYWRSHMVSQDDRCMGDGRMHHAPFCYHGYVPLRCGWVGDVVMRNGTKVGRKILRNRPN